MRISNQLQRAAIEVLERRTLLSVDVTVPGTANPWLAGQADGFSEGNGDYAGEPPNGESPVPYVTGLQVVPGTVLTFSASGYAGHGGGSSDGPNGNGNVGHSAEDGISGISVPYDTLLGVFLTDATPDPNADSSTLPPSLDFTSDPQADYSAQTFALYQPFAIGSGVNSEGVVRQITVPAGATRLFLGTMDTHGWSDNTGAFDVSVTGATLPSVPESVGELDPGFGNQGLASHNVGFATTNASAPDGAQSVIVGTIGTAPDESFGVTRYNADGSLDANFGTSGVATSSFNNTDDVPAAVDVLSSGEILVAGTATTSTGSEFVVAEYTAAGVLDTSFGGGNGFAMVSFAATDASSNDVLKSMAVSSTGTIYLGGESDASGNTGEDFAIAALDSTGSPLASFNNGTVLTDFAGGDDSANSLALQSNGDLIAAGSATINGVAQIALARYLPTGTLDTHFGSKGTITSSVGTVYDSASSVVVQPNGQIVVGGLTASGSGSSLSADFVLQRYSAAGKLDRSFGGGSVTTSFGQPSAITQIALSANGDIIASGKTTASLDDSSDLQVAVARYTTRGVLDTTFNNTGKTIIELSGAAVATTAAQVADDLGAAFDAFIISDQGVISITPGGEILAAGNSGTNTVEAELITAGVDLVASLLATLPAAVTGGSKAKASVTILESGTDPAIGTVTIDLQVAADAQGDDATTFATFPESIKLKNSQSHSFKINFTFPASVTAGNYYLAALVDNGTSASLADLNTQNNLAVSSSAVNIAPPFVNLVGSNLTTKSTFTAGKTIALTFTLTNAGNVPAKGSATADVYLSTTSTQTDPPTVVGKLAINQLATKPKPYRLSFKLPDTVVSGTYYLIAVIDPTDSVGTNDQTSSTITDTTQVTVG